MDSIIRLLGICCRTPPLRPMAALEDILDLLEEHGSGLVLLPRRALCSPGGGALSRGRSVLSAGESAFDALRMRSREREDTFVFTSLFSGTGVPAEEGVIIHAGEYRRFALDELPVFCAGEVRFTVVPAAPEKLPLYAGEIAKRGVSLVLVPSYEPMPAGDIRRANEALRCVSAALGCAVLCVNGGVGETSSPCLWRGFCSYAENGVLIAHEEAPMRSVCLSCDTDCDAVPPLSGGPDPVWILPGSGAVTGLLRPMSRTPYLPDENRDAFLDEVFECQAQSLASRLENTGIGRMVLGVSGGLDSTLALLCCCRACELLGLPPDRVAAVTMPGFGTTDRTYFNALQLIELLGCTSRDIPIAGAVSSHFEDIGHDPARRDTTYENAQARERMQVLFDLANDLGALVVGTGDLSEAALGFSTFGGDHLAGYNVNICLNKTTIRALVERLAQTERFSAAAETLRDVLDTPVSPELLPPGADGATLQKSEEILGPYALHDFFLYYTLRGQFSAQKLLAYATAAFCRDYAPGVIEEKLRLFLRRFASSQFKRSCAPDAARILEPNLCGYDMPSDLNPQTLLGGL